MRAAVDFIDGRAHFFRDIQQVVESGQEDDLVRRFMRFAFGLLYNQLAWTYDLVSWTVSAGQWRSWQRAALPYLRGRAVLEIAHGTGNLLLDLISLGFQPVGLDLSPAMGRIASHKLKRAI